MFAIEPEEEIGGSEPEPEEEVCYVCGRGDHEPQFCPQLEQPHEERVDLLEMYGEVCPEYYTPDVAGADEVEADRQA
eukprot:5325150-Heterocapsa_arctica.AAC.1